MNDSTMAEMNWTELKRAADDGAWVLLPLGVIEEHGPHLPLATDILIARILCLRVRDLLEARGQAAIVAPPFHWGICQANAGFIGCFAARAEAVSAMLLDILASLNSFGFTRVLGINAHNDVAHALAIMDAFKSAREALGIDARFGFGAERLQPFGMTGGEAHIFPIPPPAASFGASATADVHAGDIETAIIRRYHPELVDAARAKALPPVALPGERAMDWLFGGHIHELSPEGYLGDPAAFEGVDVEGYLGDLAGRIVEAVFI